MYGFDFCSFYKDLVKASNIIFIFSSSLFTLLLWSCNPDVLITSGKSHVNYTHAQWSLGSCGSMIKKYVNQYGHQRRVFMYTKVRNLCHNIYGVTFSISIWSYFNVKNKSQHFTNYSIKYQ